MVAGPQGTGAGFSYPLFEQFNRNNHSLTGIIAANTAGRMRLTEPGAGGQVKLVRFGPRVQAVVGYLTGRLGLFHRDVVEAMETIHGEEIGLGSVAALQQQVSAALAQPVATAQDFVVRESLHHVDETGWPEGERLKWLWIHATPEVPVFTIRPGRTKEAAQEILGRKFTGVVNTDRYNAYHWVGESKRQLCWAHLKREFHAIKERGEKSAEIGEGLLIEVSQLFGHW